ncbi:TetR/AcrR family transcriptional regulator [Microlunatus sp. Gsoil 973]|uniref:TetR/AcrR family transcriptional regulator n=1 Tax=Microlunatus sp. Gsoil 973 TaxID=2672569 RepID=UPI0012B457DD|nr:TetR family transcriptional regulator [Microlunatus sp. Gsoil 973]QGN34233.1 TetR family transcriptional regulator [Microlunatus sp. Gsoil 973]
MSPSRSRGQHAGLEPTTILRAAIGLADREGLRALSMRRLGAELGVEAMAIYHHFPNKDALLDAIVGELVVEATTGRTSPGDWQDTVRGYGVAFYDKLTAHRELVPLVLARPAMTSGNLQILESLVGMLCDAGFTPEYALDMVYAVGGWRWCTPPSPRAPTPRTPYREIRPVGWQRQRTTRC